MERTELIKELRILRTWAATDNSDAMDCRRIRDVCDAALEMLEETERVEGCWKYDMDDEGRARWRCSRCGKAVHRDPAEKLYCSRCGARCRKEA